MKVCERFLRYVKIDTKADPTSGEHPSSPGQKVLGKLLVEELRSMGIEAEMDEKSYVYAHLPANSERKIPSIAFIAHLDTSQDFSGENVNPRIIENYDGGDVVLNEKLGIVMKTADFPFLESLKGQSLIVTDGTTLLGADDKAGIAEIMTLAEWLVSNPDFEHGDIKFVFTPDEEIGEGPLFYDYEKGGADFAFTVDGGKEGMINYENFNAASCEVTIMGLNIHPGTAKGIMKNSLLIAMEYNSLLPPHMVPAATSGYEGFYHLNGMEGDVEMTKMHYLVRNHDWEAFQKQKSFLLEARDFLNRKHGEGTVEVEITDTYYNMKEKIKDRMEVVELAMEATKMAGLEPFIIPIRGGTDGAQLTYKGLLCPNLGTGGWNAHGRFECVTVEALEKCTEVLVNIVKLASKKS
ncbi:MAG TPA: peptidase T [Acholeplasmataceae bacterium]|nr:peptidase T [Acholeplasmataceae bacterium]